MKSVDITGQRFGRLVALQPNGGTKYHQSWLFRCDCGTLHVAAKGNVTAGHTKSCGCYRSERGIASTVEYKHWSNMISRCKYECYSGWNGRGIKVCDRWIGSFDNFLNDMGLRPASGYSLDRIDNDGDYEPGNVRWATAGQQARNNRRNRLISIDGEDIPLVDAVAKRGLKYNTVLYRLRRGWSVDRALRP